MNIIITESQLDIIREYENNEVLYYQFESKVREYLKSLLNNPNKPNFDSFFTENNIRENILQNKMMDLGILSKKKEGFDEPEDADGHKHSVHYKQFSVKNNNFDNNMHKLYDSFFEKGKRKLNEDGEGGFAGGASSCGGLMVGSSDASGGIAYPFGKVQRRPGYNAHKKTGDVTKQESNVDMSPAMTRNKDEKNGSISMNRQK